MSDEPVFGESPAALGDAATPLGLIEDAVLERAGQGMPGGPRVDAHVHIGRDADGHALDVDDLLRDMERCEIDRAICFAPNDPGDDGSFRNSNDLVLAAAVQHPQRVIPFARVDPHRGALREIARAAELGARGLKLHPVAQSFKPEAPEAIACVRDAAERGWAVVIHAGFGARPLAAAIAELSSAAPEARLVLAHGGRGDAAALAELASERSGLFFDTSLASLVDTVALPPERLLFGSDRPYGEHASALHLVTLARELAGWSDAEAKAVLAGNALRLLGEQA